MGHSTPTVTRTDINVREIGGKEVRKKSDRRAQHNMKFSKNKLSASEMAQRVKVLATKLDN